MIEPDAQLGSAKLVTWVPWRMLVPSVVRLLGPEMINVASLDAPLNALLPIVVTVDGRVTVVRLVVPWKALALMVVIPVGRVMPVSPVASWNAPLLMLVMLVGRVAVPVQLVLAVMAYVVAAGARV